jgi:3-oxoacyl-[acyl-carrier-protein] synthase-3
MLYLHGMGHFHPENVIDNAFLESLDIGTDDAWILERTGIKTRRTVLPLDYIRATKNADVRAGAEAVLVDNAETGARAARLAIERARLRPDQIGLVLAGGCCADFAIPAEAARIAARLGIEAPALDLSSACSSFGAHVHFVDAMRPEALPEFVLLVSPENNTRAVDYRDRASCVLWGDGTSAAVVSARVPAKIAIDCTSIASNPAGWDKVTIPRLGHFAQDGRAVQTFAIKTTRDLVNGIKARAVDPARLKLIAHQANLLMLQAVCRYTEIPEERCFHNVVDYGNTGAAGAPSILSMRWDEWRAGDEIALAVVGSGLTWSAMRLEVRA